MNPTSRKSWGLGSLLDTVGDRELRSQRKIAAARKQREKMKRHNKREKARNKNWGKQK